MTHPIHPVLVHFPISCWALGTCADVVSTMFAVEVNEIAKILIIAGLILSVPAMLTGMVALIKITQKEQIIKIATIHMYSVIVTWIFYAASLWSRMQETAAEPIGLLALFFSLSGLICLCIGIKPSSWVKPVSSTDSSIIISKLRIA